MATREQARAKFALEKVKGIEAQAMHRAKYKADLLKLPARLHTNGLGQTVAFYLSEGEGKPAQVICTWIEDWLHSQAAGVYSGPPFSQAHLIDCITGRGASTAQGDLVEAKYRQASQEVRALAVWLKRFAEAFISDDRT